MRPSKGPWGLAPLLQSRSYKRGGKLLLPSVKILSAVIAVSALFPLLIPGRPECRGMHLLFPTLSRFLKNKWWRNSCSSKNKILVLDQAFVLNFIVTVKLPSKNLYPFLIKILISSHLTNTMVSKLTNQSNLDKLLIGTVLFISLIIQDGDHFSIC